MSVKILHCADFHLDSVFAYLPLEEQNQRREELLVTFTKCMYSAVHNDADIVVISGDLFDSHFVCRDTCEQVKKVFERICDKKVYICAGNHDYLSSSSPLVAMDFPRNVHIFSGNMECIEETEYDIYGISFTEPYAKASFLEGFTVKNPDKINILVMHGDFGSGEYNPVTKEMLAKSGFDYIALGHSHSFQEIHTGNCCAVFSGVPEGRGFDEDGEKGIVFAWVKKSGTAVEFIPMNKRTLHICEVSAEGAAFPMEIAEKIKNVVSDKNDLYKIVLTGETNLKINTHNLADEIDCFFIKIYDRTQPKTDYESLAEELSLKGRFVKNVINEIGRGGDEELLRLVLKKGMEVLEGR